MTQSCQRLTLVDHNPFTSRVHSRVTTQVVFTMKTSDHLVVYSQAVLANGKWAPGLPVTTLRVLIIRFRDLLLVRQGKGFYPLLFYIALTVVIGSYDDTPSSKTQYIQFLVNAKAFDSYDKYFAKYTTLASDRSLALTTDAPPSTNNT